MEGPTRTKRKLDLETKMAIIDATANKKISQVAKEYGLSQSTVSTILKSRTRIHAMVAAGASSKRARLSQCRHPELEDRLFQWTQERQLDNLPLNGPILKEQALKLAESLGIGEFAGSNGWLVNFKQRHGLVFGDQPRALEEQALNRRIERPKVSCQEAYTAFTKFREYIQESDDPKMLQACFEIEDFFINELIKEPTPIKQDFDVLLESLVKEFVKQEGEEF